MSVARPYVVPLPTAQRGPRPPVHHHGAQPQPGHLPPVRHLTVRPHQMATGTRNPESGTYLLDSLPNLAQRQDTLKRAGTPPWYSVYVPPQCTGARRCPLLVYLSNQPWQWRLVADRYGIMMLFLGDGYSPPTDTIADRYDVALRQTLRQFAIDPNRIAIGGTCSTGGQALYWGRSNLQIFSRIIEISPVEHYTVTTPPQNKKAEFYLVVGVDEQTGDEKNPRDNFYLQHSMRSARELQRDGFRAPRVQAVLDLRTHEGRTIDYDLVARWLHESWARPNPAARPKPVVVADPPPLLTEDALARLSDVWGRLLREPDSIAIRARLGHLRQVVMPVGTVQRMTWMSDLAVLAAKYPSVAADLKAAGLTARQADAYRLALVSARATWSAGAEAGAVPPNSVLGRNVAFYDTHPKVIQTVAAVDIWRKR